MYKRNKSIIILFIMNTLTITRYKFEPYFDGYFQDGNFYSKEGKKINKKSYNGCLCIQNNRKRYGIVKLRKFAQRIEVAEEILPF